MTLWVFILHPDSPKAYDRSAGGRKEVLARENGTSQLAGFWEGGELIRLKGVIIRDRYECYNIFL